MWAKWRCPLIPLTRCFMCLSKRNPTHSNRPFSFVVQRRPSTHPIHGGLVLQTCKLCYSRKKGTPWLIWGMRGPQHHQIWKQGGWETQSKEQPLTHEPRETLPQPDETSVSFITYSIKLTMQLFKKRLRYCVWFVKKFILFSALLFIGVSKSIIPSLSDWLEPLYEARNTKFCKSRLQWQLIQRTNECCKVITS